MEIYVLHDGKEIGPLTQEKTWQFLNQGSILPDDLAWTPGMGKWEPLSGILPPADEPAVASEREPAPAAPAPTHAPVEASPLETATPKQRALLAFLHIGFTRTTSKVEAAIHISDALENPAYATRLAQWPAERLKLHGDLFVAELQARKENRAHHYLVLAQSEGAALFNGVTKGHTQSVITHLDLEKPQWEANESTAAREFFFPALAEKFPQLVRPDAQGRLPGAQKSPPESSAPPPRQSRTKAPGRSFPFAAVLRGLFFIALIAGLTWFVMKVLEKKPGETPPEGSVQSSTAAAATPAIPDPTPPPATPAPAADLPEPAVAPAPMAETTAPTTPAAAPAPSPEPPPPSTAPAAPAALVLTKPFAAQLTYGSMTLPAGTALRFIGQEGALLRVQYLNNTFLVPASATNRSAAPATMPGM